jgi:hypothetical protein
MADAEWEYKDSIFGMKVDKKIERTEVRRDDLAYI